MTPLPTILTLILPLLVTALTGLLSHDQAPSWANSLIAALVVLGLSIAAALLDQGLTPNLVADFVVIAGYSAALMASPILKPLYQWLSINTPSPLAALVPAAPIITRGTTRAPQPFTLPDHTVPPPPPSS